jgi:hypothetical protein
MTIAIRLLVLHLVICGSLYFAFGVAWAAGYAVFTVLMNVWNWIEGV